MKVAIILIGTLFSKQIIACDMPLKPGWKYINVKFVSICKSKNCGEYRKNDPHSIRKNEKVCLANVIVDGKKDTAAIFGFKCSDIPDKLKALTLPVRCYKTLPMIVEIPNSQQVN